LQYASDKGTPRQLHRIGKGFANPANLQNNQIGLGCCQLALAAPPPERITAGGDSGKAGEHAIR